MRRADGGFFFGVETADGFELVGQAVGDGGLSSWKDEHICADGQGGKPAEDVAVGWLVPAS
jgi:hypothetical protein